MSAPALRTPALLVGAGVSGSITALELAYHGVPSIVLERASRRVRNPDLLLVKGRSMELLRRLGLADDVRAHGVDPGRETSIVWSEALDGPPVLISQLPSATKLRHEYETVTDGSAPIEPYLLISGPGLTARLRDALRSHRLIDLRTGWTLTDLRLEPDRTVATAIDGGSGLRRVIEAGYVAGCDGAQSTVRRCLGIPMVPLARPSPHYIIYFRSPELVEREQPSARIAGGVILVSGHDGDLCVAHLPVGADSTVTDPAGLLQQQLGLRVDPPRILAAVQRDGEPGVARAYGRGRAFLAGEAAHRFDPPGADVDTCIGDAVDLGWRLAATIHGWAGAGLLAEYEGERRRRALQDGELARRAWEARSRFRRLVAAGATREFLADVLSQEAPQLDPAGTGPAGMTGAAGFRPPAFRLTGGGQFFDRLGPMFTLVDLTSGRAGRPLVEAAQARRIPLRHLPMNADGAPPGWADCLVLIRPDQQVVWRSDHSPVDCDALLDEITGRR